MIMILNACLLVIGLRSVPYPAAREGDQAG